MNWTKINSLNDIPKEVFANNKNGSPTMLCRVLLTIESKYGARYIMPICRDCSKYSIPYTLTDVEGTLEEIGCKLISYAVVDPDSKTYHNIKPGDVFVFQTHKYQPYVVTSVSKSQIRYTPVADASNIDRPHDIENTDELIFIGKFTTNDND